MLRLNFDAALSEPADHSARRFVAAIGNFDGIHLGHQFLLRQLVASARAQDLDALAVVFWPHPRAVLQPEHWIGYLSTPAEREVALSACGINALLTIPFDQQTAALSPAEFVQRLVAAVPLRELWVGVDFRFGHRRSGDVAMLRALTAHHGIRVVSVDRQGQSDGDIGSSRIRAAVAAGQTGLAASLLGRPYRLGGVVVPGDRRGRTLGFPTANLAPDAGKVIPGHGVYAATTAGDVVRAAAVNVGTRPQFNGEGTRVEAFLLDFQGDLYGQRLDLDFHQRLREERRFATVADLVAQMGADVEQVRTLVG